MTLILLGVATFTLLVVGLVALLIWARARLVPAGDMLLLINDEPGKALKVPVGRTLLGALSEKQVFIASGCGGKGTCGLCRVQVEGAGEALPTERGFFTRGELERGARLACQVRIRSDLKVRVPAQAFDVRHWTCRVKSNRNVGTFIKELILELPAGEEVPFRAGGYVQIRCPPHQLDFKDLDVDRQFRDAWDRDKLWRFHSVCTEPVERAYSMANYPEEKGVLIFTVRICFPPGYRDDIPPGIVSSWIFGLKPGDAVTVSGPFGEFFARDGDKEMVFIGGGAGMAPMRSHVFDQFRRLHTQRKVSFWYGARSLREAFYLEDFNAIQAENPNFTWHLALSEPRPEDNWNGYTGFIHQVLYQHYLKDHPAPEDIEFYMCGPRNMSVAVIDMLLSLGVERGNIMFDNFAGN